MAPSECLSQQRPSTSRQPRLGPTPLSTYLRVRCFSAHWLRRGRVRVRGGRGGGGVTGPRLSLPAMPRQTAEAGEKAIARPDFSRLTLDCCFVIGANCKENSCGRVAEMFPGSHTCAAIGDGLVRRGENMNEKPFGLVDFSLKFHPKTHS